MKLKKLRRSALVIGALGATIPALDAAPAAAAPYGSTTTILGVTGANRLVSFDAGVGTLFGNRLITNLQPGESILSIDVRPVNGRLYGLGSTSRLYVIDADSGVATQVGSAGAFTLSGTRFAMDFNPTVDRIRVVSDTGQNLRLHPDTGNLAFTDGSLAYGAGDPGFGTPPTISAAAYTNSVAGATTTTLYDIDTALDSLSVQNPPNAGTLTTVGGLGTSAERVGFDIGPGNTAYVSLRAPGASRSSFGTLDLATGAYTQTIGSIAGGILTDIAVALPRALEAYAFDTNGHLFALNPNQPAAALDLGAVTGLASSLKAIDFRPADGRLYGLGDDDRIYVIDTTTLVATAVGSAGAFSVGSLGAGFDFNPVPDRIRLTSQTDQNLRLHPDTGALAFTDGTLAYAVGDANAGADPSIVASAYTNSFKGTATTTLYDVDEALNALVIQNPPNNGTLTTVGTLTLAGNPLDVGAHTSFDIATGTGGAYLVANPAAASGSTVYRVDLATGALTQLGSSTNLFVGFAIRPITTRLTKAFVDAGEPNVLTITLNAPAQAGGVDVALSSNNAAASPPPSIRIPAGATSMRVRFATSAVASPTPVTITATIGSVVIPQTFTVRP